MREHVRFMDGLRGIAVLMVVLFHGNEQRLFTPEISAPGLSILLPPALVQTGAVGVEIFFFISGFALLYPVAQHAFEGLPRQSLREFARRRALKILPSYVIALVVLSLLLPLEVPDGQSIWLHFAAHLFFLHGFWPQAFASINGPLWTLAIEVQFYCLFPWIARAFEKRPNLTLAAMVAVSIAYRIVLDTTGRDRDFWLTNQLPDFFDLFGFGMYAAWTIVKYRGRDRSSTTQLRWSFVAAAAVLLFYGLLGDAMHYGWQDAWKWNSDHRDLEAVLLFGFAVGTGFGTGSWRAVFSNRPLLLLGTISYNLYLWNKAALVWYNWHWSAFVNHLPPWTGSFLPMTAALMLPFAIAIAMTYGVERPILAGGWRTIYRPALAALRRLPDPAGASGAIDPFGIGTTLRRAPLASIAAFAVPLVLFATSMRRIAGDVDGSELVAVSAVGGIAHATGYPLLVMLGWLFAHAIPLGTVTWRVVAVSTLSGALAAWLLSRSVRALGGEAWIATGCAIVFATGDIVWSHATDAGFAPLALALFAGSLERLVRYARGGAQRTLELSAFFAGLGASVEPVVLALVPAIALVVAARRSARTTVARTVAAGGAALIALGVGLLPYAAIPIRASAIAATGGGPMRVLGKPPGEAIWNPDDPSSLAGFVRLVTAADAGGPTFVSGWLEHPGFLPIFWAFAKLLASEIGDLAIACACAGLALMVRQTRSLGFGLSIAGALPALIALGFPGNGDVGAYLAFATFAASAFSGIALSAFVRLFADAGRSTRRGWILAALAFGAINAAFDNDGIRQRANDGLQSVVINVGSASTADAIVIAPWDQAMFLADAGYAEKLLSTRTIDASTVDDDLAYIPAWSKSRSVFAVGLPPDYRAPGLRIALVRGKAGDFDSVSSLTVLPK